MLDKKSWNMESESELTTYYEKRDGIDAGGGQYILELGPRSWESVHRRTNDLCLNRYHIANQTRLASATVSLPDGKRLFANSVQRPHGRRAFTTYVALILHLRKMQSAFLGIGKQFRMVRVDKRVGDDVVRREGCWRRVFIVEIGIDGRMYERRRICFRCHIRVRCGWMLGGSGIVTRMGLTVAMCGARALERSSCVNGWESVVINWCLGWIIVLVNGELLLWRRGDGRAVQRPEVSSVSRPEGECDWGFIKGFTSEQRRRLCLRALEFGCNRVQLSRSVAARSVRRRERVGKRVQYRGLNRVFAGRRH